LIVNLPARQWSIEFQKVKSQMFKRRVNNAAFEAEKQRAAAAASSVRAISQAGAKKGTVPLKGIFISSITKKAGQQSGGGGQGQGAGGSGGGATAAATEKKKPPPVTFQAIVRVSDLASSHVPDAEYKIVDKDTIAFPARDTKRIGLAKKNLDAKRGELDTARTQNAAPDKVEALQAAVQEAESALDEAAVIVDWVHVRDGSTHYFKTFDQDSAKGIPQMCNVTLVGVEAQSSFYNGRTFSSLGCTTVVAVPSSDPPVISLAENCDLSTTPLRISDPDDTSQKTFLVFFNDFENDDRQVYEEALDDYKALSEEERKETEEPVFLKRGNVLRKMMNNPIREEDWKQKKDKQEDRLKATWSMTQVQDGSNPDYPEGTYVITALFLENGWSPEEQMTKNTLRKAFGINNAERFAKIMCVNPVPALIACSVNNKDSVIANPGLVARMPIPEPKRGVIVSWGNAAYFCLREYLLNRCMRVSEKWVRRYFQFSDEEQFMLNNEDATRPCLLNRDNLGRKGRKICFAGNKVFNLNEFSGFVPNLIDDGAEFRVMHSSYVSEDLRDTLAELEPEEAEKVLDGANDAKFNIPRENMVKIIYAVQPLSEEEREKYKKADEGWKKRALDAMKAEQERQKAFEEAAVLAMEEAESSKLKKEKEEEHVDEEDPNAIQPMDTREDGEDEVPQSVQAAIEAEAEMEEIESAAAAVMVAEEPEEEEEPKVPSPKKRIKEDGDFDELPAPRQEEQEHTSPKKKTKTVVKKKRTKTEDGQAVASSSKKTSVSTGASKKKRQTDKN